MGAFRACCALAGPRQHFWGDVKVISFKLRPSPFLNSYLKTKVPEKFILLKIILHRRLWEKTAALTQHTGKSMPIESIQELRVVISEIQRQAEKHQVLERSNCPTHDPQQAPLTDFIALQAAAENYLKESALNPNYDILTSAWFLLTLI